MTVNARVLRIDERGGSAAGGREITVYYATEDAPLEPVADQFVYEDPITADELLTSVGGRRELAWL